MNQLKLTRIDLGLQASTLYHNDKPYLQLEPTTTNRNLEKLSVKRNLQVVS